MRRVALLLLFARVAFGFSYASVEISSSAVQAAVDNNAREQRAKNREAARERRDREKPWNLGGACVDDADCEGYCLRGRCVVPSERKRSKPKRAAVAVTPAPLEAAPLAPCSTEQECSPGQSCLGGQCMSPPPPPATEPETPASFRAVECSADVPCGDRQSCVNGVCVSPAPPPSSALERAVMERYVLEREVQLRQDLALGEGPVIATLARYSRASVKDLSAHRKELARTLGQDRKWPARFLAMVETFTR
jgi:hypothetical protein